MPEVFEIFAENYYLLRIHIGPKNSYSHMLTFEHSHCLSPWNRASDLPFLKIAIFKVCAPDDHRVVAFFFSFFFFLNGIRQDCGDVMMSDREPSTAVCCKHDVTATLQ